MQLGRYQLVREIARSNDIVYEARDPQMNRRVAVKELLFADGLTGAARRDRIERFFREARAAGQLTHPNIVTVHEVGEDRGRYFIAMEFLEGGTLRQRMSSGGPLPVSEAVRIASALCDALEYAHQRGIVHRDIKPDNVHLLPNGQVKLTDFGIARILGEEQLTVAGQVFGTPSYMAPEQIRGGQIGPHTDVFALGVLLYEMIAGRKPFPGDSVVTITYKIMSEPTPPLPSGTPALEAAILRATAKEPTARFAHAGQLRDALRVQPTQMPYAAPSAHAPYPTVNAPYPPGLGANGAGRTMAYGAATQLGVAPGLANPAPTYQAPVPPPNLGTGGQGGNDPVAEARRKQKLLTAFGIAVVLAAIGGIGIALKKATGNFERQSGTIRITEDMNGAANLYKMGQYERAAVEFQRLRRAGNADAGRYEAWCYRELGHKAQNAGDYASAKKWYDEALALLPDDPAAKKEAMAAGQVIEGTATPAPSNATPEPMRTTEWPKAPAPGTPKTNAKDFVQENQRAQQDAQRELSAGDMAWQAGNKQEAYQRWNAAIVAGPGTPASLTANQRLMEYGGR